eukprot:COSAG01_NODE_45593_length_408_cov_0.585761_2_plen_28_part_01
MVVDDVAVAVSMMALPPPRVPLSPAEGG